MIENVDAFNGLVEKEKSTISNRSKALFTLSAICTATNELLAGMEGSTQQKAELASRFWTVVSSHMAEWNDVRFGRMRSSEVRKDYICSLSITLVAIGCAGNALIASYPDSWEQRLRLLAEINWRKNNPMWENLVFINGKVAANRSTQRAMSAYMKDTLLETVGTDHG